jgi:putative two-component system response regulator
LYSGIPRSASAPSKGGTTAGDVGIFLRYAKEMAFSPTNAGTEPVIRENWPGTDPGFGPLMALADVYDAIISRRVYKDPIPHAAAVEIIREESGKQFDPTVVQAFLELADRFREISEAFRDEPPGS